jgi:Zn-dependent peptidase ImmA (M78 family)/DNA-binding XRE family transcriptional regulator
MSIGVRAFRGGRLKEARLARGLYKSQLGDMVGVSGTAITRYEDGIDNPQAPKLSALADALKFPLDFFMKPEWHEPPNIVFWRSRASETQHARLMTEQRMTWLCEVFAFLEQEVDFPALCIPDLGLPEDFRLITPDIIERAAEDLREIWKLRDQPIPNVILALENAGIPVVTLEIPSDKQDGFFFKSSTLDRFFVGINTYEVSAARARYDAGHELGHAILHANITATQVRDTKLIKTIESQAHRFAAAFLFPRSSFRREVGMVSLDYLCDLKKRWGMSIAAMIYRAYDLGMIDDAERSDLYRKMTRRRWRGAGQEPFDDRASMPLEQPRMLRRGVEAVINEGIFGLAQFKSTLALPDREIEQLLAVQPEFFTPSHSALLAQIKPASSLSAVDLESGKVVDFVKRRQG